MAKSKSTMWIVFYSFLFIIGGGLTYAAFSEFQKTKNLLQSGVKTTATVIQYSLSQGKNGSMYKPVFEFKDRSLQTITFESGIASKPPAYEIGEKVAIIYNPRKTDSVKTISFWGLYRGSVILFMIAAPFLIIGGSYLLYQLY